jgi:hypothetical protein
MKKQAWLAIPLFLLTACAGASETGNSAPTATGESPSPSPIEARLVEVRGMKLSDAYDAIKAIPGFTGKIMVSYNEKAGDPTTDPSKWTVIDSSPWEKMVIPENDDVTLTVALPGAPADKAAQLDSMLTMLRAVEAAGVVCEEDMPASEAEYPDTALNCTNELVFGHWDLDSEKSKLFFGVQKESYASDKGEGSAALAGPNWTVYGKEALVTKIRTVLGGTML